MNQQQLNQSLLQLKVSIQECEPDKLNRHRKQTCLFLFIGLSLWEISWACITPIYYSPDWKQANVLLVVAGWIFIWAGIGIKKGYIGLAQYFCCIQGCFHTLMICLSQMLLEYHLVLCGSGTGIIFFGILSFKKTGELHSTKIFAYLYIWYALIYYEMSKTIFYFSQVTAITMILLDVYCIVGIFVFFMTIRQGQWSTFSKDKKLKYLCSIYLWGIVLVLCLAGSFPVRTFGIQWGIFTLGNHAGFLGICIWLGFNRGIFPSFWNKDQEDPKQIMFQVSEGLLSHRPLNQIKDDGEPLNICTICYECESSLCYKNCGHVCLCLSNQCALSWMVKGNKKCPMCRTESKYILEVKRIESRQFQIVNKFRIPDV